MSTPVSNSSIKWTEYSSGEFYDAVVEGHTYRGNISEPALVTGDVDISNKDQPFQLPSYLYVKKGNKSYGSLDISDNDHLKALPSYLHVEGDLYAANLPQLTSINSTHFFVGGFISFRNCRALKVLPLWFTSLGHRSDGSVRVINLQETGISQEEIEKIKKVSADGIQFIFSEEDAHKRPSVTLHQAGKL